MISENISGQHLLRKHFLNCTAPPYSRDEKLAIGPSYKATMMRSWCECYFAKMAAHKLQQYWDSLYENGHCNGCSRMRASLYDFSAGREIDGRNLFSLLLKSLPFQDPEPFSMADAILQSCSSRAASFIFVISMFSLMPSVSVISYNVDMCHVAACSAQAVIPW